ncbi:MAG TPA: hypothetical protein VFG10_04725 [Saprospiraceae bacterium]|nr:hypothetical protein [Saprospiraceae bacterium]
MTSPPDKLFHDKLEHLRKTPPPAAWQRIEAGLNKTKPKRMWLMIAAAVTILLAASSTFWNSHETTVAVPSITREKTETSEITNQSPVTIQTPAPETDIAFENKPASKITTQSASSKSFIKPLPEKPHADKDAITATIETQKEELPTLIDHSVIEPTTSLTKQTEEENMNTTPQNNKIIYTAHEVNTRFLKKKVADIALATEKGPTTIQRIFDFTYGLKNDETAYGDLRQIKNEILSLPSKEKTRTQ